jgi:hypothetical protein
MGWQGDRAISSISPVNWWLERKDAAQRELVPGLPWCAKVEMRRGHPAASEATRLDSRSDGRHRAHVAGRDQPGDREVCWIRNVWRLVLGRVSPGCFAQKACLAVGVDVHQQAHRESRGHTSPAMDRIGGVRLCHVGDQDGSHPQTRV